MSNEPPDPSYLAAVEAEGREMAMLAHLAALVGCVFPFGNILGPLAILVAFSLATQRGFGSGAKCPLVSLNCECRYGAGFASGFPPGVTGRSHRSQPVLGEFW